MMDPFDDMKDIDLEYHGLTEEDIGNLMGGTNDIMNVLDGFDHGGADGAAALDNIDLFGGGQLFPSLEPAGASNGVVVASELMIDHAGIENGLQQNFHSQGPSNNNNNNVVVRPSLPTSNAAAAAAALNGHHHQPAIGGQNLGVVFRDNNDDGMGVGFFFVNPMKAAPPNASDLALQQERMRTQQQQQQLMQPIMVSAAPAVQNGINRNPGPPQFSNNGGQPFTSELIIKTESGSQPEPSGVPPPSSSSMAQEICKPPMTPQSPAQILPQSPGLIPTTISAIQHLHQPMSPLHLANMTSPSPPLIPISNGSDTRRPHPGQQEVQRFQYYGMPSSPSQVGEQLRRQQQQQQPQQQLQEGQKKMVAAKLKNSRSVLSTVAAAAASGGGGRAAAKTLGKVGGTTSVKVLPPKRTSTQTLGNSGNLPPFSNPSSTTTATVVTAPSANGHIVHSNGNGLPLQPQVQLLQQQVHHQNQFQQLQNVQASSQLGRMSSAAQMVKNENLPKTSTVSSHIQRHQKDFANVQRIEVAKYKLMNKQSAMAYPKPSYSYSCLIALSLKNSKTGCLSVSEIYRFMGDHFPYFLTAPSGWKNSVRHNLSLNKCFEKIEKLEDDVTGGKNSRKGCLWTMHPEKIAKMDDEVAKSNRKDVLGIKRGMSDPENLELLEKGLLVKDYSVPPSAEEDDIDDDGGSSDDKTGNDSDSGQSNIVTVNPTSTVSAAAVAAVPNGGGQHIIRLQNGQVAVPAHQIQRGPQVSHYFTPQTQQQVQVQVHHQHHQLQQQSHQQAGVGAVGLANGVLQVSNGHSSAPPGVQASNHPHQVIFQSGQRIAVTSGIVTGNRVVAQARGKRVGIALATAAPQAEAGDVSDGGSDGSHYDSGASDFIDLEQFAQIPDTSSLHELQLPEVGEFLEGLNGQKSTDSRPGALEKGK